MSRSPHPRAAEGNTPEIWISGSPSPGTGIISLMAAANTHRSRARSAQVLLRFSPEDRETIKRLAHDRGLTVQEYAEHALLGRDLPLPLPSGQRMLPLTG